MANYSKAEEVKWSDRLAYCVGLIASDGNLSKDGRHIVFVSKDLDLIKLFRSYLNLGNRITDKKSGFNKNGKYYQIQFGNVRLYRWLNKIGIAPNKSKTIGKLQIPNKYFFDFLKGLLDGDGCIYSFNHPESRYPQIRVRFSSASKHFLLWLRTKIYNLLSMRGKVEVMTRELCLVYYKHNSIKLLKRIYRKSSVSSLNRKFKKAQMLLAGVAELAQA